LDDTDWVLNAIEAKIKALAKRGASGSSSNPLPPSQLYLASPSGRPRNLNFSVTEEWYRVRGDTRRNRAPSLMSFGHFSAGRWC